MVRLDRKTVAKLQTVVLIVKGVDRFHWPPEKLKIGGVLQDNDTYRIKQQEESSTKKAKPIPPSPPVIAGKEYPQLFGQKVLKQAPTHEGPVRFYNFKEEAENQLKSKNKPKKDDVRKSGGSSSASASSSSSSSSSAGKSSSSSSSSSFVGSAQSKNDDDDMEEEPNHASLRGVRRFETLDEEGEEEEQWADEEDQMDHYLTKVLSMPLQPTNAQSGIPSSSADAKESSSSKRSLETYDNFFIPEYHIGSLPDDVEGVENNQYNMSECEIDESHFGKQKYHKGLLLLFPYFLPLHPSFYFIVLLFLMYISRPSSKGLLGRWCMWKRWKNTFGGSAREDTSTTHNLCRQICESGIMVTC